MYEASAATTNLERDSANRLAQAKRLEAGELGQEVMTLANGREIRTGDRVLFAEKPTHLNAARSLSPPEPGDKPIILRPDDRPKKQSAWMLKAECPECGYTIRLTKKCADLGLPSCPIDDVALVHGGGEGAEGSGLLVRPAAALRS